MTATNKIQTYLQKTASPLPLIFFRIALGSMLFASIVRFWYNGWIEALYINPKHYFPFYGFEFVTPLGEFTYILFILCGASALMVALGLFYRVSSVVLFASFTYIELIDKSTYLNHYYFISLVCLLMIFLPANTALSLDALRNKKLAASQIPAWCTDSVKLFVGMLYFFAGLAKVNSDWLIHALPLRIWLPAKNDLPIIGGIFNHLWVAYAFAWIGCLYDLCIPFLLSNKKARPFAYMAVVIFHTLTSMLFPIGMFPYVMMATALIFFSPEFFHNILTKVSGNNTIVTTDRVFRYSRPARVCLQAFLAIFFIIQSVLPFRYLAYPGELFWTEQGYRFSWRVMLMEKAGHAEFTVKDTQGRLAVVDNKAFLTTLQEKMMTTQPDMILQYAHILRDHYTAQGFHSPQVYVDSYVALNGRLGMPLIDPHTNLANQHESFRAKPWILPHNHDSKGL